MASRARSKGEKGKAKDGDGGKAKGKQPPAELPSGKGANFSQAGKDGAEKGGKPAEALVGKGAKGKCEKGEKGEKGENGKVAPKAPSESQSSNGGVSELKHEGTDGNVTPPPKKRKTEQESDSSLDFELIEVGGSSGPSWTLLRFP